jgi:flagellar basal-body rod modification protein FlgD
MTEIASTLNSNPVASTQATKSGANSAMGKDQFLKLFVAQLQHQDPMSPMQDSDFMGQMAQFSTLEQISNLANSDAMSNAIGLIGRTVTYKDKEGVLQTGAVEKVTSVDGKPSLTVGGTAGVDPSSISQVA